MALQGLARHTGGEYFGRSVGFLVPLERIAARLEDRLHMHAFDLPGHGRSDDWPGDRDMQELSTAMESAAMQMSTT